MKDVKIARNIMVYVGKSWIECYYKWYSVRFLSCGCFRAWLLGIRRTFFISCWLRQCLYPLLMRCVVSALRRLLKKSSFEQILLSRNAMLKGIDFLVWDGRDGLRRYGCLSVGLT